MNKLTLLKKPWMWHAVCCAVALLGCIPLLWPQLVGAEWQADVGAWAGKVIMTALLASLATALARTTHLLLRLRNMLALGHVILWLAEWSATALLFSAMAWVADVPPLTIGVAESKPGQQESLPAHPQENLTGPDALFIPISAEQLSASQVQCVQPAPCLTELEEKHSDLLSAYLDASPRWRSGLNDDTFFSKPGHVVMAPPRPPGSVPELVHVAFRRVAEGSRVPQGYLTVKPGDPMPGMPEGSDQMPDLAVYLGQHHYLLLAWRGSANAEMAQRVINTAIAGIDAMARPLLENPTPDTMHRMLEGKRNIAAREPRMLLNQPPSLYGIYQAEIYANPGEPGDIILRVASKKDNTTLRCFLCPAQFSANDNEVFRHDIPGMTRRTLSVPGEIPGILPPRAPLFTILVADAQEPFEAIFEVWFRPALKLKPRRRLFQRTYILLPHK